MICTKTGPVTAIKEEHNALCMTWMFCDGRSPYCSGGCSLNAARRELEGLPTTANSGNGGGASTSRLECIGGVWRKATVFADEPRRDTLDDVVVGDSSPCRLAVVHSRVDHESVQTAEQETFIISCATVGSCTATH